MFFFPNSREGKSSDLSGWKAFSGNFGSWEEAEKEANAMRNPRKRRYLFTSSYRSANSCVAILDTRKMSKSYVVAFSGAALQKY